METRHHKQICWAQNFLRKPKLVRRLVGMSTIGPSDTVYEIGPGHGIITAALARVASRVIAVERDPDLVRGLRERFRLLDNVEIVEKDFRAFSIRTPEYKIFANIPYNITAQVLRKILSEPSGLVEANLILQKEAAQKFSGSPRETLVSVLAKPFFEFQILSSLRRTDFCPVPNVDSVLLSIKRRTRPLIDSYDVVSFRDFVQYGFSRWKPNLRLAYKHVISYKQWKRLAGELDFPINARPTDLRFDQWLEIYGQFKRSIMRELGE